MLVIRRQEVEVVGCNVIEEVRVECSCLGGVFAHAVAAPKGERKLNRVHWSELVRMMENHQGEEHRVSVTARLHSGAGILGLAIAMSDETDTWV